MESLRRVLGVSYANHLSLVSAFGFMNSYQTSPGVHLHPYEQPLHPKPLNPQNLLNLSRDLPECFRKVSGLREQACQQNHKPRAQDSRSLKKQQDDGPGFLVQ